MLVATLQLYELLEHLILWSNPLLERALLDNSLELLMTVSSGGNLFIRREILIYTSEIKRYSIKNIAISYILYRLKIATQK